MAQFDVLSAQFIYNLDEIVPVTIVIDNPAQMILNQPPAANSVPSDVEIVQPGEQPTSQFWVHADNFHLTIILKSSSSGANPLEVSNNPFYNDGESSKFLDIIIAEKDGDKTKTRKIRRGSLIVMS